MLFSCNENDDNIELEPNLQPGVVITFDDDFVDEWFEANNSLQQYDWKATFFVTRFNQFSEAKVQKLKDLKNYGHEIGGHGVNHLNAQTFISTNGISEYLNQEIIPMVSLMNDNNFNITSFAYPYGSRNSSIDNLLLNEFQIIRGTTYGNANPSLQNCFFTNTRLVFGLGIDNNYSHFNISYFISLL